MIIMELLYSRIFQTELLFIHQLAAFKYANHMLFQKKDFCLKAIMGK